MRDTHRSFHAFSFTAIFSPVLGTVTNWPSVSYKYAQMVTACHLLQHKLQSNLIGGRLQLQSDSTAPACAHKSAKPACFNFSRPLPDPCPTDSNAFKCARL